MTKTGTKVTKGSKSSDAKDAKNLVYGDINEPEVSENLKNKTDISLSLVALLLRYLYHNLDLLDSCHALCFNSLHVGLEIKGR